MKLLYYVFPLFAAILLYACVKEINLDRKQFTPLPVVNCLFTPDSTWTVFVATTKLLNDPSTALISNATVSIYADNQLIENLILGQAGQYKGYTKPQIGIYYTLKVQIPGFPEVTSSDAIPQPVAVIHATAKLKESFEAHCDPACTAMLVQFSDPVSIENFYEIEVYRYRRIFGSDSLVLEYILGSTSSGSASFGTSTDPVLLAEGDLEYVPTTVFFSDGLLAGNAPATVTFDLGGIAQSGGLNAIVRLRSVSKDYYLFRKSWTRHFNRQWINPNGSAAPGTVFYTPPLDLTTNIQGGLGIFAGFSSDTIVAIE